MAKISVAVLFLFLTVSQARIPLNLPANGIVDRELPNSHTDSDVSSSILRLPSDSVVKDESHSIEAVEDLSGGPEQIAVRSTPLSIVRFHSINHRFPIRSRFPFRNCHHRHHRRHSHPFFKPIRPQQQHEEIPYGNDMILASGENSNFDPVMFHHGGIRRIPARATWVSIHDHDDDEDGFKHSHDRFDKDKLKKHLHQIKEKKEEESGGFVKRIRKFLDHHHF